MSVKKRVKNLRKMLSLYNNYLSANQFPNSSMKSGPIEFVKHNYCDKNIFLPEDDETIITFYDFCTVRPFLQVICVEKDLPDSSTGLAYLYTTLFLSDQQNQTEIFTMITRVFKPKTKTKIINFLTQPDLSDFLQEKLKNLEFNFIISMYNNSESDGIKNRIKNEIMGKTDMFEQFKDPAYLLNNKPAKSINSKSNEINYDSSDIDIKYIIKDRKFAERTSSEEYFKIINEKYSQEVIQDNKLVSKMPTINNNLKNVKSDFSCDNSKMTQNKKNSCSSSTISKQNKSANSLPVVRTTITQILRENADIQKKTQQDEKLLQNLCNGFYDPSSVTNLLAQVKESEEETELFEIERKHLLGQISLEEAKIAKLNVQRKNKEKALELKEQQKLLDIKLAKFREEEEEKIRNSVEKSHSIVAAMRNSQLKTLEAKKQNAKNVQQNSKALEELKIQRQKEELERKIQLIRQIKELEMSSEDRFRTMFGKSDEINLRTSCQMSIEELKASLTKMKENISREINERREKILKDKAKQEEMLNTAKEKIAKYRKSKEESVNTKEIIKAKKQEVKLNPKLQQLKHKLELKKLELARIERKSCEVSF